MYSSLSSVCVRCCLLLSLGGCSLCVLHAQSRYSSYTFYGIGNPHDRALVQQVGSNMTLASFNEHALNLSNPSWLARNEHTSFHLSLLAEDRQIISGSKSYETGGSDIQYAAFGVPIVRGRWYSALSLFPYAQVGYAFSFLAPVASQEVRARHTLRGSGGVNQFSFSHGLKLTNNVYAGLTIRYLYGLVKKEEQIALLDTLSPGHYANHLSEQTYGDFAFEGALGYLHPLRESAELMVGVVYKQPTLLRVRETALVENRSNFGHLLQRTLPINKKITYLRHSIPVEWGLGLSYRHDEDFMAGLEGYWRQWGREDTHIGGTYDTAFSLRAGVQWVPNAGNLVNYFLRMPYRVGLGMSTLPYVIVEQDTVVDYYASVGFSVPLRRGAFIDVATKFGYVGSQQTDFLQERYVQYHIGTTLGAQWFLKGLFD